MSHLRKLALTFLALSFLTQKSFSAKAAELSFEDYIEQVKSQNLNYSAANLNAESFELLKEKAKSITAIKFYGYSEKSFAEQNQVLQIFPYNRNYSQRNQIGFTQNSDFGLSTNLYYSLNKISYKGLNTSRFPDPNLAQSNYQSTPTLSLSFALWQNRFGASTRAQKDATFFENEAKKLAAKSLSISSLVEAEKNYWGLVFARKNVEIQESALKSAKQVLDYVSKKETMNLGEKSDVLQAKALFEGKKLALIMAQNQEKIVARSFNKQRFIASDEVKETLSPLNFTKLESFLVPKVKAADRFDLKADEASMKSAVAAAKVEEENNKPALNLYGSYAMNQIKKSGNQAIGNSFDDRGRSGTIGVNFSVPINFGLSSDIRKGALQNASAAKISYRQKAFDHENDWQNLVQNLANYQENLKLARMIEASQKKKVENERSRLKQGRTSTYQVLLFEQDYSNSQLTTIQIANTLLGLIAEEKLYQQ